MERYIYTRLVIPILVLVPFFGCHAPKSSEVVTEITEPNSDTSITNKAVKIITLYDNKSEPNAKTTSTGFIVTTKGKYYLVTNYHVIPGMNFVYPETPHYIPYGIPINATVKFHGKGINMLHDWNFDLKTLMYRSSTERPTLLNKNGEFNDITFIQIDSNTLSNIYANTVDLESNLSTINRSQVVYICGFRDDRNGDLAFQDSVNIVVDKNYLSSDKFIFFTTRLDLHGNSGAPCFVRQGNKYKFIGIESASNNRLWWQSGANMIFSSNNSERIGVIISKSFIQHALETF